MNNTKPVKKYTEEEALLKLMKYCAYQERCQFEVRKKLSDLGVFGVAADNVVTTLITQNYLNEERFAVAYAGGKHRVKGWGIRKITFHLKKFNISEKNIKHAIKQLDTFLYEKKLVDMALKKYEYYQVKYGNTVAKQKTIQFFLTKGYSLETILKLIPK